MYELAEYNGDPNIGVFIRTSEEITLVPIDLDADVREKIRKVLKTEIVECSIWDTSLIGILSCMNSNGIVLPKTLFDEELKIFKSLGLNIGILESDYNAIGNLIVCNDRAAIVSPILERENLKIVEDVLDVEVLVKKVSNSTLVGSMLYVTNKGILFNRNISEEKAKELKDFFGVKYYGVGSVNMGNIYVSIGIIANSRGIVFGKKSTPYEIQACLEALGFV